MRIPIPLIIYTVIALFINIAYAIEYGADKWYWFCVCPLTFGGLILWWIKRND